MTPKTVAWSRSKWLSKSDAALYIHCHVNTLEELIDSGVIPACDGGFVRGGGRVVYVNIDDLDAYMRSKPYSPVDEVRVDTSKVLPRDPKTYQPIAEMAGQAVTRHQATIARKKSKS